MPTAVLLLQSEGFLRIRLSKPLNRVGPWFNRETLPSLSNTFAMSRHSSWAHLQYASSLAVRGASDAFCHTRQIVCAKQGTRATGSVETRSNGSKDPRRRNAQTICWGSYWRHARPQEKPRFICLELNAVFHEWRKPKWCVSQRHLGTRSDGIWAPIPE